MGTNNKARALQLAALVRQRRLDKGMTVPEAANRIGISKVDWVNLEGKGTGLLSADMLIRLMKEKFFTETEVLSLTERGK